MKLDKEFIRVLLRVGTLSAFAGAALGTAWREIRQLGMTPIPPLPITPAPVIAEIPTEQPSA